MFFFFKQKTAYEMRISDWSSDVCSSDLTWRRTVFGFTSLSLQARRCEKPCSAIRRRAASRRAAGLLSLLPAAPSAPRCPAATPPADSLGAGSLPPRSEEHTSELQSLMLISYAVFCLNKNTMQHVRITVNNEP